MGKRQIQLTITTDITAAFFILLSIPLGPAPPLGPFLNPISGFWANAVTKEQANLQISLPDKALVDSLNIYIEQKQSSEILTQNNQDLYYVQCYITARDRLWQMEFQTRAAAGRLSEVLGTRTLSMDRYQRHIGMGYAAEQALEGLLSNPKTATAVKAYARGVNAWINQLDRADYPVEYKILDYAPEEWTPIKTAYLLKYLTYTLASNNEDLRMSNTRTFFGENFIHNVLNIRPELTDPIIPTSKKWKFSPKDVQKPDSFFTPAIVDSIPPFQPHPDNGSNNWAVSGRKTASGYPILANDPHLNLTLPSIWYALQLHSPTQNTMGVSLPGAPAVIIGFNEDIAWGTTNVGADVWDWYEIEFRDSTYSEYRYNEEWKPTHKRTEKIKVKGRETVVDTVVYTHHGPVTQNFGEQPLRSNIPVGQAMRWIAYEESNELRYFLEINKATDYTDYRQALRHFGSPAQNWVFADSSDIALTATGKYPLKWRSEEHTSE